MSSNQARSQEYLAELKKDKIDLIRETAEYRYFRLNGIHYIELIEDSTAHGYLIDAIYTQMGSRCVEYSNIYPVNSLCMHTSKLLERVKRRAGAYARHSDYEHTRAIFEILEQAQARMTEERARRMGDGLVAYEDLAFLFAVDDRLTWLSNDNQCGGYFKSLAYKQTWAGNYAEFSMRIFVKVGESVSEAVVTFPVAAFSGTLKIDSLPIRKIVPGSKTETLLKERGEIFAKIASGEFYVEYTGLITKPSYFSDTELRADGRVMIDPASMARIDSDTYERAKRRVTGSSSYDPGDDDDLKTTTIDEKDYFACSPYVFGFSFRAKTWGLMQVSGIKPIKWAEDAFERLVLEGETKKRVRALVQNSGDSFSDIIGGKGGGCVFLLHGEPGQGKTLTAETVAEDLKRPLYSISVGELGTDPDQLETRLREILDLATVWNAVLLLDEADIFLEARDERDVLRNAMVGVFLRLLEYHQGVLFLTTNRVRNIDRAFYSRISVAIAFGKADHEKRAQIWTNLLNAAGIDIPSQDVRNTLASIDLNGRQIKNVIRIAGTMARQDGEKVTTERLVDEIGQTTRFEREMLQAPDCLTKPKLAAVA